jgi:hypothetical protein
MKFRGLMLGLIALAILGGLVYWSLKKQKADAAKPSADTTPKILSVSEDQIKQIEIKKKDGENTLLAKADGKWQIVQPKPLRADQDSVTSLVSTVSSLNADRLIEEKSADLSQYGLNAPSREVTVTQKDGKTRKVLVGDDTPTGGGAFAKLDGDPRVFTIASYTKTSLEKSAQDLRDKRLLTFDSDKLTRVDLQAKGQNVEFGKNNQNDWQILKPRPLRADGSQVEDLVRKLKDARMDTTVSADDARKAGAAFAAGTRVATAVVTDANGSQTLEVRKDKDKNYYAKSSAVEGIYKVTNDLGEGLDKGVDDFRNKKLFDFGFSDPSKIEVRNGATTATYQKSGDKWTSSGKQMDSASVQALVDKLRDLTSIKFVESGYSSPIIEVTVTSNDGKRVEKVGIAKQGNTYLAKRESEPSIYELDSKAVEALQGAASAIKEDQPAKNQKK